MESIHSTNGLPLVTRRNKLLEGRSKSNTSNLLIYNTWEKGRRKRPTNKTHDLFRLPTVLSVLASRWFWVKRKIRKSHQARYT